MAASFSSHCLRWHQLPVHAVPKVRTSIPISAGCSCYRTSRTAHCCTAVVITIAVSVGRNHVRCAFAGRNTGSRPLARRRISPAATAAERPEVVALDTEFVGVGSNTVSFGGSRNALARLSVVACSEEVLLDCIVQVPEPIVDFRIAITGLTQVTVDQGIPFEEAKQWAEHILHGRIVVGHSLVMDWKVLGFKPPEHLIRDTAVYIPLRPPGSRQKKPPLADLAAELLNKDMHAGVHDSVEDAVVAMQIYRFFQDEWEASLSDDLPGDSGPRPAPPPGMAPTNAAMLVRRLSAQASLVREQRSGLNTELATMFEELAAKPGANRFAVMHYRRVASTFASLPYIISCEEDLERPELRCIGKAKTLSRKVALDLIRRHKVAAVQ